MVTVRFHVPQLRPAHYTRAQTPPRSPSPPPPVYSRTTQSRETQADAPPPPQVIQLPPQQPVIEEHAFKQTTTKRRIENDQESDGEEYGYRKPIRFAVRSLGWTEIAEEDLTAERSSRAVNRAIVDLSTGRNDVMDNVSKWGDGRELIMELDDNELTLIDPDTMTVVHSEKIPQIRVWGVGRDNGREKGCNQTTLNGAFGPPVTPTDLTHMALSTNRPCVMGLTPFESKQMGVASALSAPIRVAWLRPFFLHDDTHPPLIDGKVAIL
ncbi:hypothetical protein Y032_0118g720 [Ancylostoma ceylanicum]|uniref:PID domain-containing protein n=1 Tax=Ancylostoma ceylanicum TaxID=53326 RepID=A0A016TAN7_9BILA|nr:hypothetical protein Y032_0118g720 [Ancylostoma ceylanicum]